MCFFIGINPDQTLRVRTLMRSADGQDQAHFQTVIQPGQSVFGFNYDTLKHFAETQGYFDYEETEPAAVHAA